MNARDFMRKRGRIESATHLRNHQRTKALAHLVREARALLVVADSRVVGYLLPTGETVCVKRRFRDQDQADAQLRQIERADTRAKCPVRAYPCGRCNGWHLTSQLRHDPAADRAPDRNTSE